MTGTSWFFGCQMLKRAFKYFARQTREYGTLDPACPQNQKISLMSSEFRSPHMLQDWVWLPWRLISKCIFLRDVRKKGSFSHQRMLPRPRTVFWSRRYFFIKAQGRFYIFSEDPVSDWSRRCCWGRRCQFSCLAHLVLRGGGRIEGVICSTTASFYDPWWCSCRRLSRGLSRPSAHPVSCGSATLAEAGPTSPPAGAPGRPMPLPRDSPRRSPRKIDIRAPATAVGLRPRTLPWNRNVYRFLFYELFDECALSRNQNPKKRFEMSKM